MPGVDSETRGSQRYWRSSKPARRHAPFTVPGCNVGSKPPSRRDPSTASKHNRPEGCAAIAVSRRVTLLRATAGLPRRFAGKSIDSSDAHLPSSSCSRSSGCTTTCDAPTPPSTSQMRTRSEARTNDTRWQLQPESLRKYSRTSSAASDSNPRQRTRRADNASTRVFLVVSQSVRGGVCGYLPLASGALPLASESRLPSDGLIAAPIWST
mmetsp:Transcript_19865/g.44342  ORF Transcript_19865/g.44342 Transcript_19865/m.44342 type:complete len:210 (-) Transcript_19865:621-1250(-)